MGYTTEFSGRLILSRPVTKDQMEFLNAFSATRRMSRKVDVLESLYHGQYGFEGNYGKEGEYFAKPDNDSFLSDSFDDSVIDYNRHPSTQPGLWCQWILSSETTLEWDGNEKFYNYIEWLQYLIDNFFKPWGISLIGDIEWQGEEMSDFGTIIVKNNSITTKHIRGLV